MITRCLITYRGRKNSGWNCVRGIQPIGPTPPLLEQERAKVEY